MVPQVCRHSSSPGFDSQSARITPITVAEEFRAVAARDHRTQSARTSPTLGIVYETFAVVIPTRDRADLVTRLVRRIAAMPDPPDQLIVVDDGSLDDTPERLASLTPPPTIVSGRGEGPSATRNRGAAVVTTDWLVFIDDDDHPSDDWIGRFRAMAAAHPDAAYVSIGHEDSNGVLGSIAAWGPAFGSANASFLAGTFAIRTDAFRSIGGFDEHLFFGEFTDLALRAFEHLQAHGRAIVHDPPSGLRLADRPPGARSSLRPEVFVDSGLVSLRKNEHLWTRDPEGFAVQLSILGVAAMRAERTAEGRALLRRAVRLDPTNVRHLARAGLAYVPVAGARAWRR